MYAMRRTTIGAVDPSVRDAVAEYRDENGLQNYNKAVAELLRDAGAADKLSPEA
jgi:hypothetical protein